MKGWEMDLGGMNEDDVNEIQQFTIAKRHRSNQQPVPEHPEKLK